MVVGIKDTAKLAAISVIACCAVLVCTLFLNYNIDIAGIKDEIPMGQAMLLSLVTFLIAYELALYCYGRKIDRVSVREIMLE